MILRPDQSVNDLVYFNSEATVPPHSENLQVYDSPALAVDDADQSNQPGTKTKS